MVNREQWREIGDKYGLDSKKIIKKKEKEFSQKQQLIEEIHEAIKDGQNLGGQIKIKESKVSGR